MYDRHVALEDFIRMPILALGYVKLDTIPATWMESRGSRIC